MAVVSDYATGGAAGEMVVPDDARTHLRNRVSWGAILAGVAAALVVQLLLNILGVGIGASAVDAANTADNPTAGNFSLTGGVWFTLSGIIASLVGGIVAGRLCGTSDGNTARWHGFVSWCVATLMIVYLLTSAVGGIVGGTFNALGSTLGSTLGGVGRTAASAATGVAQNTNGDALQAQVKRLVNPDDAQSAQENVVTYIRASANGDKQTADASRDRAVDSLAKMANISPDEARTRLTQAEQQYRQGVDDAKQKATQAAEATRKGVASAGIFGFVALALGALAGWFGGGFGAPRRDLAVAASRRA